MKSFGYLSLLIFLLLAPSLTLASITYPEGEPADNPFPDEQVLGATDEDEVLRQSLMQLIVVLQARLRALLDERAISLEEAGEKRSFDTGSTVYTNEEIELEVKQASVKPYLYDGNDVDDNSLQFALHMEITNKSANEMLIIDRDSLALLPVNKDLRPVVPAKTFNTKTGYSTLTALYGFDEAERKLLAIKPGQSSVVLVYHSYQFSSAGEYRGQLAALTYVTDEVVLDEETNQFMKNSRVYEVDPDDFRTLSVGRLTVMVNSLFEDKQFADNKYDLTTFSVPEIPVTFSYPEEFSLAENGDGTWTISYDGFPYFVVSGTESVTLPEVDEEVSVDAGAFGADRMEVTTWTYSQDDVSGLVKRYVPLAYDNYSVLEYEYAEGVDPFVRYDVNTVFGETFVKSE